MLDAVGFVMRHVCALRRFSTERKLGEANLVEAGIVESRIGFKMKWRQINTRITVVDGNVRRNQTNNTALVCAHYTNGTTASDASLRKLTCASVSLSPLMAAVSLSSLNFSEKLSSFSFCSNATNKPLISFSAGVKLKLPKSERRSSNFVCRAASSVAIRDLDADDFRHPLDRQNTLLLRAIPGLNEIGKALLGTATEQVMLLENIGTSVLVSKNQLPELHELMVEAASILNIEAPDLYLRQSPVPNAYTLAISGKKPFVVVHTSLVELLSRKELQAVLAHELGHLKCDHGVWLTFANILTLGAYSVPGLGGFIAQQLEEQLFRWLRAAELTCDRAALLVARDPKVVISVLMKLAGGCPSMADQLNVDAFLEQARSYEKASSSPVGWYISNAQMRQLSHPLPVLRAREIDEWSRSKEYQSLLKRVEWVSSVQNV